MVEVLSWWSCARKPTNGGPIQCNGLAALALPKEILGEILLLPAPLLVRIFSLLKFGSCQKRGAARCMASPEQVEGF